jgi:3',5'-cyclic AMP phosphodiesterase CpdA
VPGGRQELLARTLRALPGEELTRLATISDVHLGNHRFGYFGTIVEDPAPPVPHAERCAAAALHEAAAWGAERLVVKGDVTDDGEPDEWRTFRRLRDTFDGPVDIIPGNHDVRRRTGLAPAEVAASFGLDMTQSVTVHDLPGLRLILMNTTLPGRNIGRLETLAPTVFEALETADPATGVLIAVHHQLQPHRTAEGWPWGIPHDESRRFIEAVGARHRHVLITSGHTHRHRRWAHAGVTTTQVGSTKDYPGVWAGYVVHEGGMRQVVRRVMASDVMPWTERTRWAALGAWGLVSPGRLDARCFAVPWFAAPSASPPSAIVGG